MSMVNIAKDPLRIPEQGELVDARHRQWLVSDVEPFHPEGDRYHEQHAVTLESIEEDANVRYTIFEPARIEILKRLAALNRQRREEEEKAGLHKKNGGK